MLKCPKHGWVTVELGEFSGPASYLTNVSIDCLEAMIYALKNKTDFIVSFDAEGWSFKVIADSYRSFVIEERNSVELYTCDKDITDLAKELYNDISKNIKDWDIWNTFTEYDKVALKQYKRHLRYLLKVLKSLL